MIISPQTDREEHMLKMQSVQQPPQSAPELQPDRKRTAAETVTVWAQRMTSLTGEAVVGVGIHCWQSRKQHRPYR